MEPPLEWVEVEVAGRRWRLETATDQDALFAGVRTDDDLAQFPYGLLLWPSALGLAQRLAETPPLVRGRRVLELGCGVGLAGLAAAALGGDVTQTDYQSQALALAGRNARANGLPQVRQRHGDWRDWPDALTGFDTVLASDVLYERTLHAPLMALLPRLIVPGGTLLIADPVRPQALEALDAAERDGWGVALESRLVDWDGGTKEIALAWLTPPPAEDGRISRCAGPNLEPEDPLL